MPESRSLKRVEGWGVLVRGQFEARHDGHLWTVDVDYLDFGEKLRLYRDGELFEVQKAPATFDVGDGATIEASMSMLGMRRVDLVDDGSSTTLTPVDGTLEAWRCRFDRERPELSRAVGALSWIVLVVAFPFGIGELLALAGIDNPLVLGQPLNTLLGLVALAAVLERALRFKSSRWLG